MPHEKMGTIMQKKSDNTSWASADLIQDLASERAALKILCHNVCSHGWLGSDFSIRWSRLVMAITNVVYYVPATVLRQE